MIRMRKEQQEQLKNSIRCCISCILPCGALDVIRIVHYNGHVQEIGCSIRAADILQAHPKHVLKTPATSAAAVVVVPPDALLQRGKIYFLVPSTVGPTPSPKSQPSDRNTITTTTPKVHLANTTTKLPTRCSSCTSSTPSDSATSASSSRPTVRKRHHHSKRGSMEISGSGGSKSVLGRVNAGISSDQYLSELLSEKVGTVSRERRRGRVGVWRPQLESISETLC